MAKSQTAADGATCRLRLISRGMEGEEMNAGLIGGIAGSIIGIAGGVIGTYFSIKNTDGPKERAFIIKASAVFWAIGIIFVTFIFVIESPYKWFIWLPYGVIFPTIIRVLNRRLSQIRQEESQAG